MLEDHYFGTLAEISAGTGTLPVADSYSRPAERVQSVFAGATGAKTVNVTGVKRVWDLGFDDAEPEVRHRVEGYWLGYKDNTWLRFFEAYTVNMLDLRTSTAGASPGVRPVFSTLGSGLGQILTAPAAGVPRQTRLTTTLTNGATAAREASAGWPGTLCPALGTTTFSVYLRAPSGAAVTLYSAGADGEAFVTGTLGGTDVPASGAWQRAAVTVTPPAGTAALYPAVSVPASGLVEVAHMQTELGPEATPWVAGTGARVVVCEVPDDVTLYPYDNLTLRLAEV
ncbi:hypothetical protein CU254_14680 [Amycolatopsis sp. AA4]|uniref:hypothetical protein n=1 Tax=Actinomycetes TaxID=1760 RepID=UPI0001B54AD3|nr:MULTISPECIES: hypothetical protein [Actinomycetes]ATY11564.1 hypothetical protein CU254_14680 [Amycolatopsis sp. AA4]